MAVAADLFGKGAELAVERPALTNHGCRAYACLPSVLPRRKFFGLR